MSASMQAAVITAPRRLEVHEIRVPDPAPGEVCVRLEGCGVCASNLAPWQGKPWFQYPFDPGAPGHEGWGRVHAVGRDVGGLAAGDRVGFLSGHAFAEFDVAAADAVLKLPSALDSRPFPAEPIGCAMNIFRRAEIRAGQTVAIVGAGFLGILLTQLAADAGATIIAISRRIAALMLARRAGADVCVEFADRSGVVAQIRELTHDRLCEVVIEAAGTQATLDLAAELTGTRGRLIIAGYHQDGSRTVNMQLWNWRGLDVINAHERDPAVYGEGMRAAVAAVDSGLLDPSPLYTHTFGLSQLGEAFELAAQRPPNFMKALITMPGPEK